MTSSRYGMSNPFNNYINKVFTKFIIIGDG